MHHNGIDLNHNFILNTSSLTFLKQQSTSHQPIKTTTTTNNNKSPTNWIL
jgi:hypothetical protein